jgi:hypothetical protein
MADAVFSLSVSAITESEQGGRGAYPTVPGQR